MNRNTLLIILAFAAIYFIWGTTFLAIAVGLKTIQPFTLAALRFMIAGVLLVGYSLFKKESIPPMRSLIKNALIGLVVLVGGQGLLIWSEQHIASGYASVLVATLPIWFVVLDKNHWNLYFKNYYILAGVFLGFVGIAILFGEKLLQPENTDTNLQMIASVLVIFGAVCWVAGTLYNRSRPAQGSLYRNLGWQLIFGSVICLIIGQINGESIVNIFQSSSISFWAVVYLAIAGSIIAYIAYSWLLTKVPSAIVGTYAYINPIVAVFLGWAIAKEEISFQQLIGMTVILISALLINLNRNQTFGSRNRN